MKQQHKLSLSLALVSLILLTLVVIVSAGSQITIANAFPVPHESASAAVSWLHEESQNSDGGFGKDFITQQPASSVESTLDAVLAISATGYSADIPNFGREKTAIDYLRDHTADLQSFAAIDGGPTGKIIMALTSAKIDARNFEGHDYVAQLQGQYDLSGSYNNTYLTAFYQAISITALVAVDEPVPGKAIEWLEDLQADDGSWDDGFGTSKNADATALSIMALLSSGRARSDASIVAALNFLRDSQLETGGWEYGTNFGENANSTALVVQALAAAGEDFYSGDGSWSKNGFSPLMALLSWQNTSGAYQADFGQGRSDNFFATAQAVPASLAKPYPYKTFLQLIPIMSQD